MKNALVLVLALFMIPACAQDQEIIVTGDFSSAQLPALLRRDSYELEGRWENVAQSLPTLRIVGGTLRIDVVSERSNRLTFRKVILDGGRIITNGADLTINALELEVRRPSFIQSFDQIAQVPTLSGEGGQSGLAGGTVTLNVREFRPSERLVVDLSGAPGQEGGVGASGPPGANGANGAPARFKANILRIECQPGTYGGTGGRGGEGGPGGRGGDGGDGGNLVLGGILVKYRSAIEFISRGGEPGPGGRGGAGGPGGPGGFGGRSEGPCPPGPNGDRGPEGVAGPAGSYGTAGRPGSIRGDL